MRPKIPKKLTRKAVRQEFTNLSEASWDHLFEHEKTNGLSGHRVEGPYPLAYYRSEGLIDWLVMHGHYKRADFIEHPMATGWSGLVAKRHAIT